MRVLQLLFFVLCSSTIPNGACRSTQYNSMRGYKKQMNEWQGCRTRLSSHVPFDGSEDHDLMKSCRKANVATAGVRHSSHFADSTASLRLSDSSRVVLSLRS